MNRDMATIVGFTVGACAVVGLLGTILLSRTGHWPLRRSVVVAAMLPVLAVVASVLLNVRQMFISRHDSIVVLVALSVSAGLALLTSVLVGRSVTRGTDHLGARLASLTGPDAPEQTSAALPREIAQLADELDRTRQQLAAARDRERALERSRRELVAFMSHDLRTPLAGVRALAEGLEDGVIDDVPAALSQLQATVDRMSGLVDDLFELSRLSAAPSPRTRRPVSLVEVVDDVASELGATARQSGVTLCVDGPEGADRLAVQANADELSRALTNIVANGIRHTPAGGTVRLSAGRDPRGGVQVTVEDGCGGIAESDLGRVFDVGWRADPERGTGDRGAGLGLAISRGLVESHHGSVAVRNAGPGCRFDVRLPGAGPVEARPADPGEPVDARGPEPAQP